MRLRASRDATVQSTAIQREPDRSPVPHVRPPHPSRQPLNVPRSADQTFSVMDEELPRRPLASGQHPEVLQGLLEALVVVEQTHAVAALPSALCCLDRSEEPRHLDIVSRNERAVQCRKSWMTTTEPRSTADNVGA